MTIADFLRTLRANWIVLVLALVIGAGAGFGYSMTLPRVYVSQSTGFVVVGDGSSGVLAESKLAQDRANSYLPLINSRSVAAEVAQLSSTGITEGEVAGALSASVAEGSNLIVVSARSRSPEKAQEMANLALQATANVVKQLENSSAVRVVPLEDAALPSAPASPNVRSIVLYGTLAGLVLGLAFVFLRRSVDQRIRSTDDLEDATGADLLGIVPKSADLSTENRKADQPHSPAVEAVRQLRTNLRYVSVDDPVRVLMITSANPGEGKSTVASMLARSFARAGRPTLLIDADLRKPRQAEVFGIDGSVGLTQVVTGQARIDVALHHVEGTQLYVLPAGRIPPNPAELLGSSRMAKLLDEAGDHFFVIVDAPPLLPVADASVLAASVDGAVLVARHAYTTKEQAARAVQTVERVHGNLLGVVLNSMPTGSSSSAYYGYGYGHAEGRRGRNEPAPDFDERAGEVELTPAANGNVAEEGGFGFDAPVADAGPAGRGTPRAAARSRVQAGASAAPVAEEPGGRQQPGAMPPGATNGGAPRASVGAPQTSQGQGPARPNRSPASAQAVPPQSYDAAVAARHAGDDPVEASAAPAHRGGAGSRHVVVPPEFEDLLSGEEPPAARRGRRRRN